MKYNLGLQQSLSSEEKQQLKSSDEYIRYIEKIEDLNRQLRNDCTADEAWHLKHQLQILYR